MNQDRHKRKMSAILSADVVGYSRLMEADRSWTIKNLEENKNLISILVEEYHGRVVDAPGDNILAEFSSVTNSVECAVKIQQELKSKYSKLMEEHRMEFRIGINLGEIVEEDGRIYGSGVNIAARIEGLSKSGGICISGRTYDHIKAEFDFGYEYLGEHNVKNISEPIRVYRILMEPETSGKVIDDPKSPNKISRRMYIFIIFIIIVTGLSGWYIYSNQPNKIEPTSLKSEQETVIPDVKEEPKTIAVLPFENLSSDPEQEYFVDGLSEQIINDLTKISNLNVTSRTSSFTFKDSDKTAKEIAQILEREYILEGSVRKAGNALIITAQLIRSADDSHIWSETYDREMEDIFEIQKNIAKNVADKLKLTLEAFQILGGTEDVDAYELYLVSKGWGQNNDWDKALESINKSIELDPKFALAWATKAIIQVFISSGVPADRVSLEQDLALEAAQKAVNLEPRLGKAYLSLGTVQMNRGNLIEAGSAFQKGEELTPMSIDYSDYGLTWHLTVVGYLKKCNEIFYDLRQSNPLDPGTRMWYIYLLGVQGDIKGAEEEYKHCKKIFGDQWPYGDMFITILRLSSKDNLSIGEVPELPMINPMWSIGREYIESPEEGLAKLQQIYNSDENLSNLSLAYIALWAAYFGDEEFALDALDKSTTLWAGGPICAWDQVFRKTRQLPKYKKLMKEHGLVDYWKEYGWPDLCHPVSDDDFVCD